MPAQGLLDFMNALHSHGISVADINLMAKTNPARVLGLEP
jgi:predicted metal-dependent phosphotriesterase family hydrolase